MTVPPIVSLVVPMYNEEEMIPVFLARLEPLLAEVVGDYEIVCIDDGSRDATLHALRAAHAKNPRVKVVALSRNFGKELALTAGIDASTGRAVIPFDADLQDPPEMIPQMLEKWREGYDVVLAKRGDRSSDTPFRRAMAAFFYRLIGRLGDVPIPENVGDFRLMDRRVVDALARLPERTRFMKGIFAWLGFRQATLSYVRPPRAAGDTKWRISTLWNFAIEGVISFSSVPLKIWSYLGVGVAFAAIIYGLYIVLRTLFFGIDVPGYASLLTAILFLNGLIMISLGIMGEYVARIFIEVKGRPLYLVRETLGLTAHDIPSAAPAKSHPASSAAPRASKRSTKTKKPVESIQIR